MDSSADFPLLYYHRPMIVICSTLKCWPKNPQTLTSTHYSNSLLILNSHYYFRTFLLGLFWTLLWTLVEFIYFYIEPDLIKKFDVKTRKNYQY